MRRVLAAALVALVVSVGASSCASTKSVVFPDGDAMGQTGGVVVIDEDEDGQLSPADRPVGDARIERLKAGTNAMATVARSPTSSTEPGGAFLLPDGPVNSVGQPGVQVGLPLPLENGRGEGVLHFRFPLASNDVTNVVLLPRQPTRCAASADSAAAVPGECSRLQLPDLAPIISEDQIDPGQRMASRPASGWRGGPWRVGCAAT